MGSTSSATCNKCGHKFSVNEGGGFVFHLLHCDKCGEEKSISFDELGEIHLRYLKGLKGPYCIATSENDKYVRENYPGEPLKEEEYKALVEQKVGKCRCSGQFTFDAKARCPKCKSGSYTEASEPEIMYD